MTQSLVCASQIPQRSEQVSAADTGLVLLGDPHKQVPPVPVWGGEGVLVELDADSQRMFRLLGALLESGNKCWLWAHPYGIPSCLPQPELM